MSKGNIRKLQQKDYTPEVDALLPQATALAQVESPLYCREFQSWLTMSWAGNFQEALDKLFTLEKQARNVKLSFLSKYLTAHSRLVSLGVLT